MRPAGADNYLRWRRTIDEHLELRRLSFDEYGMFNWLCTKASPRTGSLRTNWRTLAEQTGLTADHVEQLCRRLKRKRYIWYPPHRGSRGRLVEVEIDKFPTVTDTYTDLSARFPELPTDVVTDLPTELPTDLGLSPPAKSRGSPPGRTRSKERERERGYQTRKERGKERDAAQIPDRRAVMQPPVAIRDLLAAQPWWRLRPEGGDIDRGSRRTPRPHSEEAP